TGPQMPPATRTIAHQDVLSSRSACQVYVAVCILGRVDGLARQQEELAFSIKEACDGIDGGGSIQNPWHPWIRAGLNWRVEGLVEPRVGLDGGTGISGGAGR